jgi:maleylpyruvate isomerase
VTADPLVLGEEVERATDRLLATARLLDGAAVTAPSLLPGWTRGHLLTHLARNADALRNLLIWARTGEVTPAYASPAARDAAIEEGSGRPLAEQVEDLRESSARFAREAAGMPAAAWLLELPLPGGAQVAARVVWRRLREVEVHHVDLNAGYAPADWPAAFAHRLLHEVAADLKGVNLTVHSSDLGHPLPIGSGAPPTVTGPSSLLAAWLTGRETKPGLAVEPPGPLPELPDWL